VATVSGVGSTWSNSSYLYVGYKGNGTLNIADGGLVEVSEDTIVARDPGSGGAINFDSGTLTTGGLVCAASDLSGTGTINTNGLVTDVDLVFDASRGLTQTLTLNGVGRSITVNLDVDGFRSMGVGHSGNGSMHISDGVTLQSTSGYLGYRSGSAGVVTVSGAGSTWANSDTLSVGLGGDGTLEITDGGVVSSSWYGHVGSSSGSTGAVTVSGAGSTWDSGWLSVGSSGDGTLNIVDGGLVEVSEDTNVAKNSGSAGAINFDNGTLTTGGFWGPGTGLSGTGTINTKGLVSDVDLVFDASHGVTQTLTLNGIGRSITVNLDVDGSRSMGAGHSGKGSMHISDGVTVQSTSGYLGYQSGSTGEATVSGAGSTWANSDNLYVGYEGDGALEITDGGAVSSNQDAYIGYMPGSTGVVTVSGVGSTWTNTKCFNVGREGNGTLDVTNGGTVSSRIVLIGNSTGSTGVVTVSGAGSTWTNAERLNVGFLGHGVLNITDGGLVSVAGGLAIDLYDRWNSLITMATGGRLALRGDADDSLADFLGLIGGADDIRYWDDSILDWADITGATPGEDYTLTRLTEGDLAGYSVLTVGRFVGAPLSFDNQAPGNSNWSSRGNWNDSPDPGTAVPDVETPAIVGSGHTVDVVAGGQAAAYVDVTAAATLNIATAANPLAGDLTVADTVTVDAAARLNVYNRLTVPTLTISGTAALGSGAILNADVTATGGAFNVGPGAVVNGSVDVDGAATVLSDNSTVSGDVTVVSGSFTAGTGVTVGSLESESTALQVGAGGITITDRLSLHGTSGWTHTGDGDFIVENAATGNLMDGVTELVLNGGALTIQSDADPPTDAVAYYSFDNVTGTTVYNDGSGGAANNATLESGAAVTTGSGGKIGEGMTIADETAQKLTANTAIDLADTAVVDGAWTIATWFYNLHPTDDWRILTRGGNDFQVMVHRSTDDLETRVGTFYDSDYDLSPAGGWHHIAAVGSGSQTQFYVDGAVAGDVIPVRSGADIKWIGNYSGVAFAEIIDEFYVFDRALDEEEIQQLAGVAPLNLSGTDVTVQVNSTLVLDTEQTVMLGGVSLDNGLRLRVSGESDDIRLTNLTLGDGSIVAADDRDMEISVGGTLSSVGSVGHLGGSAETYEVSLTLETGARYEWEFDKTGGVVSGDLVVVNGDLTLGDDWALEFLPAAGSEWFDGTEQVDLFSFTGTLTANLANVLFDAPEDWITDAVMLHEEINRGGTGVNYVYMTGLETVPEPTSVALLVVGFGVALWRRRRR